MARHLIERACDRFRNELTIEDRREIAALTDMGKVKAALGQIEQHLAARQSLRNFDSLTPFLIAAERFSQVVEVVCNGTPYLPWIWAPLKFVIQSARDHAHVLDKMIMAYANIGSNMPRLSRYSEAFPDDHGFQRLIAYLFEDILEFHQKAYTLLKKPGWHIFFSSAWGRFDHRFSSLLSSIDRLSEQIDREAVALDIMRTAEWRVKNAEDASNREKQSHAQQFQQTMNWLGIGDDIQDDKLEMHSRKCYDGTCQWLLKSKKVRTWLGRSRGNSVLWLNGKPGSGKTILSSMLIQFIRSDPSRQVCFFFCDYNTSPLDVGTQILRTICSQIIRTAPDLVPYVYDECIGKARRPSSDVLKKILPNLISRFDDIHVVVDGIDEVPEHRDLIQTLLQLSKACAGLKLLLVSQDLPSISTHLSKKTKLCLGEEVKATREAHAMVIHGSLQELNQKRNGAIGEELIKRLEDEILEKSEGMFLWVSLVMTLLNESTSIQELQEQISALPESLADVYDRIFKRICRQSSTSSIAKITRVFAWLRCHKGARPLLKCEVRLGMALDGVTQRITRETRPWADATDICKPLIEDGPGNTLVFVHSTVPQFLFENGPTPLMSVPEAIASVTFACICSLDQALDLVQPQVLAGTSIIDVACGFHGLLPYSYQYWTQHLLEFLSSSTKVTSLYTIIVERLKQLCQKLMSFSDVDNSSTGSDETSKMLRKYLTVDEAAIIAQIMNRDKQPVLQEVHSATEKFYAHSASLREYRRLVREVVKQKSIHGVEPKDLITFKEDYGPTAFTCDSPGCSQMFRGYSSESQLSSHQERHAPSLRCYEKGCLYNDVGFPTEKKLKSHKRKMHYDEKLEPIPKRFEKEKLQGGSDIVKVTTAPIATGSIDGQQYPPEPQPQSSPAQPVRIPMYRPEQMRNLELLSDTDKEKYERGLRGLWDKVERNPPDSTAHKTAKAKIAEFSRMLYSKVANIRRRQKQENQSGEGQPRPAPSAPLTQVSPQILQMTNSLVINPPPEIAGDPDKVNKYRQEFRAKYMKSLLMMDSQQKRMQSLQMNLRDRTQKGQPYTPEETAKYNNELEKLRQIFYEAKRIAESLKAQAGGTRASQPGGGPAAGQGPPGQAVRHQPDTT